MRRRSMLALALALAMWTAAAVPASATSAVRGWMELQLNYQGLGNADTPCPHVAWVGTVDLGGVTYGISFEPAGPLIPAGDGVLFADTWRIHEVDDLEIVDGVVTICEGPGLMWGVDRGSALLGVHARADGYVVWVDPNGPFDASFVGHHSKWSGNYTASGVGFVGPMKIG